MAQAPQKILVLPSGEFQGRDGRGPYKADDLQTILRNTQNTLGQIDLPVDFNHAIEKRDGYAPAAGWIQGLEIKPDGLWAQVEWTDKGKMAVENKEFRYISPAFVHDSRNKVLRLTSVALTNSPNLGELKALSSFAPEHINEQELQRADTVLALTAEEYKMTEEQEAQVTEQVATQEAGTDAPANINVESQILQRLDDLEAKVQTMVTGLHDKIEQVLSAVNSKQTSDDMVTAAQQQGKITPAQVPWARELAKKEPQLFQALMATTPAKVKPTPKPQPVVPPVQTVTLTEAQAQVATQMGYDAPRFLEHLMQQQQ